MYMAKKGTENQSDMFGKVYKANPSYIKKSQQKALVKGKRSEELFKRITGATSGTFEQDTQEHTDVFYHGSSLDVKSYKACHKEGYVLVELKNGQGNAGWCSTKGADKIAFEFETYFIIVNNSDLRKLISSRIKSMKVLRKNNIPYSYTYALLGRAERKDVFVYIPKKHLIGLKHEKIRFNR